MPKNPKWRVGLTTSYFFMVDVEASSESEAIDKAEEIVDGDPYSFICGSNTGITSVFINDRESKGFFPYVPEYLPSQSSQSKNE